MREHKYRAWLKDKMYYQDQNTASRMWGMEGFAQTVGNEKGYTPDIMQFTGLPDKNGKEIYEGDILQYYWKDEGRIRTTTVSWDNDYLQWVEDNHSLVELFNDENIFDIEIIGNIYSNPELLNKTV
jgi:uncharacterized phage protein (TIGR01671 family)